MIYNKLKFQIMTNTHTMLVSILSFKLQLWTYNFPVDFTNEQQNVGMMQKVEVRRRQVVEAGVDASVDIQNLFIILGSCETDTKVMWWRHLDENI